MVALPSHIFKRNNCSSINNNQNKRCWLSLGKRHFNLEVKKGGHSSGGHASSGHSSGGHSSGSSGSTRGSSGSSGGSSGSSGGSSGSSGGSLGSSGIVPAAVAGSYLSGNHNHNNYNGTVSARHKDLSTGGKIALIVTLCGFFGILIMFCLFFYLRRRFSRVRRTDEEVIIVNEENNEYKPIENQHVQYLPNSQEPTNNNSTTSNGVWMNPPAAVHPRTPLNEATIPNNIQPPSYLSAISRTAGALLVSQQVSGNDSDRMRNNYYNFNTDNQNNIRDENNRDGTTHYEVASTNQNHADNSTFTSRNSESSSHIVSSDSSEHSDGSHASNNEATSSSSGNSEHSHTSNNSEHSHTSTNSDTSHVSNNPAK
ncbi:hypothetical protein TBLA_0F00590 [Henningerozyma blattae CBS 6284]|uniref:Uncharacterized protein n=1 Tax=Henningerozyma blattae (strain ATCC 34711 / CBS 6284 / DSM 70876 / NBRC 10599 / NRRL Y-10934 / UCD 77-7) TaxID=1071380 RepID=I2H5F1_HENB6|nr:hypothetical protein TBLA_0F00590 [Tetrapisispora blattae CBS 6284]CCH61603.1 hypothetical protein TBLA_0F00590 [Tetrapisispora blattae CBS 6284]